MRILVTDGDERAALAVARSLGRTSEVHVAGPGKRSLAGSSRRTASHHRVPDPLTAPAGFTDAVVRLVDHRRINVVIPVSDAACRALVRERERLGPAVLAAPHQTAFETLSHKGQVGALAAKSGIPVPPGDEATSVAEAQAMAERLGWPVVIKPVQSVRADGQSGARKHAVVRVDRPVDLERAWVRSAGDGPALVQRFVPGWGEGLFLLRWGGTTRAAFAHRRLREKPPSGGVSVLRESIAVDPVYQKRFEAILDAAGFDGVAMAEFKTDGRERWLMEFNARFWGSLQLAIDAGVDFPRLLVDAALSKPPSPTPDYHVGVRSRWLLGDLDHAIALARGHAAHDGRRGSLAALATLLCPSGPRCSWEVLRGDDPGPFLYELVRWIRDLVS